MPCAECAKPPTPDNVQGICCDFRTVPNVPSRGTCSIWLVVFFNDVYDVRVSHINRHDRVTGPGRIVNKFWIYS